MFTVVPGIDSDYVSYFWERFEDHEALKPSRTIYGPNGDNENKDEYLRKPEPTSGGQQMDASGTLPNASDAKGPLEELDQNLLTAPTERIKVGESNEKIQPLCTTPDSSEQKGSQNSSVQIVDLNGLSETQIRSISPSKEKSLLIHITLEGGVQAWCDLDSLRTRMKAVGEELPDVLEQVAENMQNNNIGK